LGYARNENVEATRLGELILKRSFSQMVAELLITANKMTRNGCAFSQLQII